jgi:hypothetical protein
MQVGKKSINNQNPYKFAKSDKITGVAIACKADGQARSPK